MKYIILSSIFLSSPSNKSVFVCFFFFFCNVMIPIKNSCVNAPINLFVSQVDI